MESCIDADELFEALGWNVPQQALEDFKQVKPAAWAGW
jgi:hypothetical protein